MIVTGRRCRCAGRATNPGGWSAQRQGADV